MLLSPADGATSSVCVCVASCLRLLRVCVCVCAADLCEAGNSWLESELVFRKAEQTDQQESDCSAANLRAVSKIPTI